MNFPTHITFILSYNVSTLPIIAIKLVNIKRFHLPLFPSKKDAESALIMAPTLVAVVSAMFQKILFWYFFRSAKGV